MKSGADITIEKLQNVLEIGRKNLLDSGANPSVVNEKVEHIQALLEAGDKQQACQSIDDFLLNTPTDPLLAAVRRDYQSIMDELYP